MKSNQLREMTKFKSIPNGKLMFLYLSKKYYKINSILHTQMTIYSDYIFRESRFILFNYYFMHYLKNIFTIRYKHYIFDLGFDSNEAFSNVSLFPVFFNKYRDSYCVSYKKCKILKADFKFVLPVFSFSQLDRDIYTSRKIIGLIDSYQYLSVKYVRIDMPNNTDYIIV
jgi:hypothetical protein